jgi:hypothetical protein
VRYPYSIGMYVITPDAVKSVCWPLNMDSWQVDAGNNQAHAERAGRALWAALRWGFWCMHMHFKSRNSTLQLHLVHYGSLIASCGPHAH